MFFVGISTHIFIYLLVPAFLIVCFYCRGIQGGPEIQAQLPVVMVYEPTATSYSADTYVYQTACPKKVRNKTLSFIFADISSCISKILSPVRICTGYSASQTILRAPPFHRFFKGN